MKPGKAGLFFMMNFMFLDLDFATPLFQTGFTLVELLLLLCNKVCSQIQKKLPPNFFLTTSGSVEHR